MKTLKQVEQLVRAAHQLQALADGMAVRSPEDRVRRAEPKGSACDIKLHTSVVCSGLDRELAEAISEDLCKGLRARATELQRQAAAILAPPKGATETES